MGKSTRIGRLFLKAPSQNIMKTCIACSMPLEDAKDVGGEIVDGQICIHCATADGKVKSCEEIFEGGVQFFMNVAHLADRNLAERVTRKNMNSLPYWQKNKGVCLDGEEASDEEFGEMMSKL